MNIKNLKSVYIFVCIVLGIIILSPTLAALIPPPGEERFSELWILGENHMIQTGAPEIVAGQSIKFYLGVGNEMGDLQSYLIYAKFRNTNESMPNRETGTPSELSPIMDYRFFLMNNAIWERNVTFSVDAFSFEGNVSQLSRISLDGNSIDVNESAIRDEADGAFYYQLFFELWIYSSATSSFQFHNHSVGFWVKLAPT